MPDRIGAFLAANEKLSSIGVNITRVSYNKAIDTHTLFLEIDGEESLLIKAEEILTSLGYIKKESAKASVILLEFHLKDEPNRLHPILVLIQTFNFNISYMSSQQNETGYQDFKIGIYVEDETNVSSFLENASRVCPVKVLHYDKSEKILDNTVFYLSFAETLAEKMKLNEKEKEGLLVASKRREKLFGFGKCAFVPFRFQKQGMCVDGFVIADTGDIHTQRRKALAGFQKSANMVWHGSDIRLSQRSHLVL